jgi:hypothetical protein
MLNIEEILEKDIKNFMNLNNGFFLTNESLE